MIDLVHALLSSGQDEVTGNPSGLTVTDGLIRIADGLYDVARALRALGTGNAATEMGAIEAHAKMVGEALDGIGEAVSDALSEIANAMPEKPE